MDTSGSVEINAAGNGVCVSTAILSPGAHRTTLCCRLRFLLRAQPTECSKQFLWNKKQILFKLFPFMEVSSQHTKQSVFYRLCKTPWVWKKNIFINNRHQYMSEIWGSVSNRSKPHVYLHKSSEWFTKEQGSWGHRKAHLGPVGRRWAPCWSH